MMGMTVMLLLTECNNKYTLSMQLFFWLSCLIISGTLSNKVKKNDFEVSV